LARFSPLLGAIVTVKTSTSLTSGLTSSSLTTTSSRILTPSSRRLEAEKAATGGGGQSFSVWDLDHLLDLSGIGSQKARQHIRKHVPPQEFVAATLYAVTHAKGSVDGLLKSVLTNPEGVTVAADYLDLADLPPDRLAEMIQTARSGLSPRNPAWNVMRGVTRDQLDAITRRLFSSS